MTLSKGYYILDCPVPDVCYAITYDPILAGPFGDALQAINFARRNLPDKDWWISNDTYLKDFKDGKRTKSRNVPFHKEKEEIQA